MQRKSVEERLKGLLKEIDEEIDISSVTEESRLKEDVGLSSVAMLYMAVSLENEFEIDLSGVRMEELQTVGDVVSILTQLQNQ